jgi:hypothetical protein
MKNILLSLRAMVLFGYILIPKNAIAESLECAMLKQEILSQSKQTSEEDWRAEQLAIAKLSPQEQAVYQASENGRNLGKAIGELLGSRNTLKRNIEIYKENCE